MLITSVNGISCMIASGTEWEPWATEPQPGSAPSSFSGLKVPVQYDVDTGLFGLPPALDSARAETDAAIERLKVQLSPDPPPPVSATHWINYEFISFNHAMTVASTIEKNGYYHPEALQTYVDLAIEHPGNINRSQGLGIVGKGVAYTLTRLMDGQSVSIFVGHVAGQPNRKVWFFGTGAWYATGQQGA